MFCYNCGNELIVGIRRCPYCKTEVDDLNEININNYYDQVGELLPDYNEEKKKCFKLDDSELEIQGNEYIISVINTFLFTVIEPLLEDISDYISSSNLDRLANHLSDHIKDKTKYTNILCCAFLFKNGVKVSDIIIRQLNDVANYFANTMAMPINEVTQELDLLKEEMNENANSFRTSRKSYWVGGGYGIEGAIKGSIKAGALNASSSLANSLSNTIKVTAVRSANNAQIRGLKKEYKNSDDFQEFVNLQFETYRNTISLILSNQFKIGDSIDESFYNIEDSIDESFYNIEDSIVESFYNYEDLIVESIYNDNNYNNKTNRYVDILKQDIFDFNKYKQIYQEKRSLGNDLYEIAKFCSFDKGNTVLNLFVDEVDSQILDELLNLPIGINTELTELLDIKKKLSVLEKHNPAYQYASFSERVKKEHELKIKIDELIFLKQISEANKTVLQKFKENDKETALKLLLKENNNFINSILFKRLYSEIELYGEKEFLSVYNNQYLPIVLDVDLAYHIKNHKNDEYLEMLKNAAKAGRPHSMELLGELYLRENGKGEEGVEYLKKAAEYQCPLAITYIGIFLKKGINGFESNATYANMYLKAGQAFGESLANKYL